MNTWKCPRCGLRYLNNSSPGDTVLCSCGGRWGGLTAMVIVELGTVVDCGTFKIRIMPSWE